jgi:hypothetical protein
VSAKRPDFDESDASGRRWEYLDDQLPDQSALERVLSETLTDKTAEPLQEQELEGLLRVARKHVGQPISLEPITVELVESILRTRFTRITAPDDYWQNMSLAIATSLFQAPVSKKRLTGLWNSLLEAVR